MHMHTMAFQDAAIADKKNILRCKINALKYQQWHTERDIELKRTQTSADIVMQREF